MQLKSQAVAPNLVFMLHVFYVFSCLERCANHSWSRNLLEYIVFAYCTGTRCAAYADNPAVSRRLPIQIAKMTVDVNSEILGID